MYISERKTETASRWSHTCQTHHRATHQGETDEKTPSMVIGHFQRINTVDSSVDGIFSV